ncbi:MAG: hypothetical protein CMJ18_03995 [Phycisphaeraceae bacterium]|nr:hypothetical protein [Phycisphaeraceae bacterium]
MNEPDSDHPSNQNAGDDAPRRTGRRGDVIGTFRLSRRGFGFVEPESATVTEDLFVPEGSTGGALTGDRVRARLIYAQRRAKAGRSPFIGRIIEIVERAAHRYVGNLARRGRAWVVVVDGRKLTDPVPVRDAPSSGAHEGDKVVVELIEFATETRDAEGVIVEVLGTQGQPDVETEAVMRGHGIIEQFPENAVRQASDAVRGFRAEASERREDLTATLVCTIDPPDARDFDDAISIEKFDPPRGETVYELGVHIADVASFVEQGSALDEEAMRRGNSIYLPGRVVPMLPEVLSNGICSLQEQVERFCKTAFIQYDGDGRVLGHRFARSLIKSAKRLTYLEAQALIDGDLREARRQTRSEPKYPQPLIDMLRLMDELARLIQQRRLEQGMIVLDLPEVDLVFDDDGRVADVVEADDAFTHKIIEMFMVEANEQAAQLFDRLVAPMIRRIHADPSSGDTSTLRQYASVAGFDIPQHPNRHELQRLLDAVRGGPAQHAVHLAVLQTLSRAEYAPSTIGHFALASDHYTHFTSPIRRYPDLIVHRALDAFLDHRPAGSGGGRNRKRLAAALRDDERLPSEDELVELGRHCSQTERLAQDAERDLRQYFLCELLGHHLGEDFDGTVTGVTGSGVFVQIDRYFVDGFISIDDVTEATGTRGRWRFNRENASLVAPGSAASIRIGDRFRVRIANVHPPARQLDLVIIDMKPGEKSQKKTKKKSKKKSKKDSKNNSKKKRKQPPGARKAHATTMKIKKQKKRDRRK